MNWGNQTILFTFILYVQAKFHSYRLKWVCGQVACTHTHQQQKKVFQVKRKMNVKRKRKSQQHYFLWIVSTFVFSLFVFFFFFVLRRFLWWFFFFLLLAKKNKKTSCNGETGKSLHETWEHGSTFWLSFFFLFFWDFLVYPELWLLLLLHNIH